MRRIAGTLALFAATASPLVAQRPPASAPTSAPAVAAPVRVPPPVQTAPLPISHLPPLPDPSGWGIHILALARGPDGSIWVGTYGEGIYVLRPGSSAWENLRATRDTSSHGISFNFVHAFGFSGRDVWYGTVGNGWGYSRDGGRTWHNWSERELGARWQYVTPNGIVTRADTVFIATADGIKWTTDRGLNWGMITDTVPESHPLPSRYVLAMAKARDDGLWISTLRGLGEWHHDAFAPTTPPPVPLGGRIRTIHVIEATNAVAPAVLGGETCAWTMRQLRRGETETHWECMSLFARSRLTNTAVRALAGCEGLLCGGATSAGAFIAARLGLAFENREGTARSHDTYAVLAPPIGQPGDTLFGTACGFSGQQPDACRDPGDTIGVREPAAPLHTWFARPIALGDQPFIDQTYRYGSTMGGVFQQHQGVEFNNPNGTTVLAIASGTVVHAGPAEQGSNTVVIRHDTSLTTPQGRFFVFSTYYHNSRLLVSVGQRVARGQPIARVGNTGRATNDHLHLEVHASPSDSVALIVDPNVRYPIYTRNPELWIEPLPGTGIVAGQVWDRSGRPVPQARLYGIVKPEPQETPFSYAETYGEHNHPDPAYGEHFAVSDVPPGEYVLGTTIEGRKLFRHIRVEAGKVTWVEFRP
jgi:murein DD-endopeptidase MepM/ murein hydrolase activator NlpD